MALQGTLDTFALADLVRLLATTTKTGELAIDGPRGAGRLWFVDGDLVAGEPAGAGGAEDALFALLRLEEGSFSFEPDAAPDGATEHRDAAEVLAAAEARLEAWRPIEALVPSPAVALSLRPELVGDEVVISRDVWRQLLAVAPGTTAGDLARALDVDDVAAATAVAHLVALGLVEVGPEVEPEPEPEPVPVEAVEPEPVVAVEPEPVVVVEPEPEPVVLAPAVEAWTEPEVHGDPFAPAPTPAEPWSQPVIAEPEPVAADLFAPAAEPVAADPFAPAAEPVAADPFAPSAEAGAETAAPVWAPPEPPAPDVGGDPFAPSVPLSDLGGSLAVDLDSHLGGPTAGHSYLGGADGTALPEPLLAEPVPAPVAEDLEPVVDEVVAADEDEAPTSPWPTPAMDEDDLALQLDALSPAAARAVAAAASAGAAPAEDGDAGRRVLRRIISSGRG